MSFGVADWPDRPLRLRSSHERRMKLRRPAHGVAVREGMRAINIRHTEKNPSSAPISARPESCILSSESYRAAMTLPVNCGDSRFAVGRDSGGKLAR